MSYPSNFMEGLSRRLFARHERSMSTVIRGIEILLVILVAVALAGLVGDLVSAGADDTARPLTGSAEQGSQTAAIIDQPLSPAVKSLFGRVIGEDLEQNTEPVRETQLNLTLKGILAHRETGRQLALISRGNQKEEVYQVGDQIEGAEIIRIEPRRVIISRNGVTESLNLEIKVLREGTRAAPASTNAIDYGNGIRRISDTQRSVSRMTYRQHLNNLPRLLQQASAEPYNENGRPAGFRVVDIQAGSIFQDLGIEQNDIIRSVNGISVRTAEEAMNAYRNLRTANSFKLNLVRGGREVTIGFSID